MISSVMMSLAQSIRWKRIMERFLKRHEDRIVGTITGFDRVLFRGTLRSISHCKGMGIFLSSQGVLLKDFAAFAQQQSQEVGEHAKAFAAKLGRPYQYLDSPSLAKEQLAREIMERDQISKGLICVLAAVESCQTITVRGDRQSKQLRPVSELRQCKHLYFYFVDREFGLMHIRLQTWFPFNVQVCVNGRRWLARKMQQAGISFVQSENTFTHISDLQRAQQLMEQLLRRNFSSLLNSLSKQISPLARHPEWKLKNYYWSYREVEIATDVMFRDPESLAALYPSLIQHAMLVCQSSDVLRFLGRRVSSSFNGEISSNLKRYEGLRVKHWVEENSIKMYDKATTVLRIETTINNPHRFKVYRQTTLHGQRQMGWLRLRRGVADTARLVQISRAANERYLEALAVVGEPKPSHRILDPVSRPVQNKGHRYRALQPISPQDSQLFELLCQGRFLLNGFRNKDLRPHLPGPPNANQRQASARISRKLQLLRAHGLIFKVPKTHYHRITKKGHDVMATAIKFRVSDIALLAA
jgi:hypothetical protein